MKNNELLQYYLSQNTDKQEKFLKSLSNDEIKNLFFDLNKDIREKAFNLLNPESQTQFMESLSLGEQREFFDTSTQRGRTIAFNSLQVGDRKAFIDTLSKTETKEFTKILRQEAVDLFWTNERELIKQGLGTRNWTPEQMEAILNLGKTGKEIKVGGAAFEYDIDGNIVLNSKGNGVVYRGHHMLNVEAYPQYAGDPKNIQPLTVVEHKSAHNGDTTISTNWYHNPETGEQIKIDLSSPDTINVHFSKYPPEILQTLGFRSDEVLRSVYKDFDSMNHGEQMSLRWIDKVVSDSGTSKDLSEVVERLSSSKKYGVTRFDNLEFFVNNKHEIIFTNLSEITGGKPLNEPFEYLFKSNLGDVRNFKDDKEMIEAYAQTYEKCSVIEKMEMKQTLHRYNEFTSIKEIDMNDSIVTRYLTATKKNIGDLDELGQGALAISYNIKHRPYEVAKFAEQAKRYTKILKPLGFVFDKFDKIDVLRYIAENTNSICDAYNSGDMNRARALTVAASTELAINYVGTEMLMVGIAECCIGIGAAIGVGPIVVGVATVLVGVVACAIAGKVGEIAKEEIMKLFGESEQVAMPRVDPLVLDLAGNGFSPTTVKDGAHFDLDQNGFAEKMNWISGDDALLAIDKNRDGKINNGNEVFGDRTHLKNGEFAKNGFEALKEYDSNNDGVIDEKDIDFNTLLIWKDADGNGISGNGELVSLKDAGIASINLSYQNVGKETLSGTVLGNVASFKKNYGSELQIAEYWVKNETYNTVDLNVIEIPKEIQDSANVKEMGSMPSLHKAMVEDKSGRIKALVDTFINSKDNQERFNIIENILMISTSAENIPSNSRGSNFDARKLRIVESMLGRNFKGVDGPNPNANAAARLSTVYFDLVSGYYCEVAAQTSLKSILPFISVKESANEKSIDFFMLKFCLPELLKDNEMPLLGDLARYIKYLDKSGVKGFDEFVENVGFMSDEYFRVIARDSGIMISGGNSNDTITATAEKGYLFGEAGDDYLKGSTGKDLLDGGIGNDDIRGGTGDDILIGGEGNDYLEGGFGSDVYHFSRGFGKDRIFDTVGGDYGSPSDKNTVKFLDIKSTEVKEIRRNNLDMVLGIEGSGDELKLCSYFEQERYKGFEIQFSDGVIWAKADIASQRIRMDGTAENDHMKGIAENDEIYGLAGNDYLEGLTGNDLLDGGSGNDCLSGGEGNDTYIFAPNFGSDTINNESAASSDFDQATFTFDFNQLIFSKENSNMKISIVGQQDKVTVQNWSSNSNAMLDQINTNNNTKILGTKIEQLIQEMATFSTQTGIAWEHAAIQNNQQYLQILSTYYQK